MSSRLCMWMVKQQVWTQEIEYSFASSVSYRLQGGGRPRVIQVVFSADCKCATCNSQDAQIPSMTFSFHDYHCLALPRTSSSCSSFQPWVMGRIRVPMWHELRNFCHEFLLFRRKEVGANVFSFFKLLHLRARGHFVTMLLLIRNWLPLRLHKVLVSWWKMFHLIDNDVPVFHEEFKLVKFLNPAWQTSKSPESEENDS